MNILVEARNRGEWDMFDLISSAYYGKGMYFKEDNEMVYSRYSHKHMTFDGAIAEFVSLIDGSNVDLEEVVRCQDCIHRGTEKDGWVYCHNLKQRVTKCFFCGDGARREE